MKKFFFLGLSLLLSVCGFADNVFHSPGAKHAGTPFEYVNISNALTNEAVKDGTANKYGINDAYPWIVYANSGSLLDNGQAEVSRSGYYVSYNPVFFNAEFVYMVDDAQKWLGSPKVEIGWVKGETYFERLVSKTISFYVKDATRIDMLLTGAGSNTNVADIRVIDAADNSVVQNVTTEAMPGKSNKANAGNTASQIVAIKGLDAAKSYIVVVAPAASATQVEVAGVDEDGDVVKAYKPFAEVCGESADLFADVDVAGKSVSNVKSPAIAVTALHIYSTDMTVESGVTPKENTADFHAATSLYPHAPFEYINLSNALCNDAVKTTFNAEGDPVQGAKYAINASYPWIYYNYTGSVLDNGQMEVARGGIYVSKNPVTAADEFVYMVDDAQKWLGSPKVEVGYTKNSDGTFNLLPKTLTFDVKDTKRVDILLTGGGSNTNKADIFVINAADKSIVKTITTEEMPGKSNKANEANTKSQYVTVDGLDETLSYYITVAPSASAAQVEVSYTDEDGDVVKQYIPFDAAPNFLKDIPNQNITNIKGPSVYVAAIRIFSSNGTGQPQPKAPANEYYSPVGKKLPGTAFAYENISNALRNDAPLTTFDAEGNASVSKKYAINDNYPWIYYNYTGSILDNGLMEVARGGYYVSLNPITNKEEFVYMVDDAQQWLGSPKVEVGYTKGESYFNKLMPKTIQFNIKEATKVDFLLTGAGSNTNVADVKVINVADKSVVKTITSEAMPGKSNKASEANTKSQRVVIDELDPTASYTVVIAPSASTAQLEVASVDEDGDVVKAYKPIAEVLGEGVDLFSDITVDEALCVSNIKAAAVAVTAIRVWGTDVTEDKALENIIAAAKAAGKNTVNLVDGIEYELNARADANGMTINGNGAIVRTNAEGQLVAKGEGLTIDELNIDASAGTQAPIALANKADLTEADTLAYRTWTVNEEGAEVMKYPNAANKVLEASAIIIKNSEIKTGGSFISGGDAAWALRTLNIDGCMIGTTAGSGKAFINWEEGASQIKDIVIVNSTLFSTVPTSAQRFHRYTSQVDPWRVWGYEGDDKNAPGLNTWTLQNNTIVNLCGNKEFSNNIKNTAATTFKFEKNVFVNSWRLNKLGSNVTRDFDYTTNVIAGGVNAVDGTDASKWAVEDADLGIVYEGLDDEINFKPNTWSLAAKIGAGDPKWKVEYAESFEISDRVKKGVSSITLDPEKTYTLNAPAVADALKVVTINGNGATIKVGAEGQFVAQKGIVLDNVVIDAAEATLALIQMEKDAAKIEASLSTFDGEASKYEGASTKANEAEKVAILNSTLKNIPQQLVSGKDGAWAIANLTIDNSIVNFNTASISGQNAALDMASVKELTIKNSTLYNTTANTGSYFARLTNASQAGKVWGNNPKDTHKFVIEGSTLVNVMGSKDFANNWFSNGNFTVELTNNVFYNCFRVKSKFVGNCSFDKEATPAKNYFDHSEGYSLDGNESQIATVAETGIVAPTAETGFDIAALGACFGVYENIKSFGDARWAEFAKPDTGINDTTVDESQKVGKFIENGRLVIKNGTNVFNVSGQIVK